MAKITRELGRGKDWLLENRDPRAYLFYGLNLLVNPIRGAVGLAGKLYEGVASEHYARNAHIVNLARAGLVVITALDTLNFNGVVDLFGDVLLTSAFLTDTSYWREKSFLKGVGEDFKELEPGEKIRDLSDKIQKIDGPPKL